MIVELGQRLRAWLRHEWQLALVSLGLAVAVFYTVRENISYTETIDVPVAVERDTGIALMSVRPANVRVTFRGAINEVRQLARRDIQVSVRAPRDGVMGGTVDTPLTARNVRGARGSRVVAIEPPRVRVTFDHQGEREFPIAPPDLEGRPLRGRVALTYAPHTAVVRGARMQLDTLYASGVKLQLERVNVDGRVQGFTRKVAILPPAEAWMPEIKPAEVTVKVEIVPDNATREFAEVPVLLAVSGRVAEGYVPDPAVVVVRLVGREEVLREVAPESLRVYATCPAKLDLTVSNTVPLDIYLPPSVAVDGAEAVPAFVSLRPKAPR